VARLIVKLTFPLLANLTLCVLLCPTVTPPKLSVAGEIVMPAWVPVPLSEIVSGELEASLVTTRLPAAAPADSGANWA
jgi:hypothetical protein